MNCPLDNTPLAIADRQGIEIDYCPKCRGVWLDRGELDKLVERSLDHTGPVSHDRPQPPSETPRRQEYRQEEPRHYDDDDYHHRKPHHKKRESFLGDLFDF